MEMMLLCFALKMLKKKTKMEGVGGLGKPEPLFVSVPP